MNNALSTLTDKADDLTSAGVTLVRRQAHKALSASDLVLKQNAETLVNRLASEATEIVVDEI